MHCNSFNKLFRRATLIALSFMLLFAVNLFAQGEASSTEQASAGSRALWFYSLLALTGVLIFVIINKSVRILELTYELNGKQLNVQWNRINGALMLLFMFAFLGGALWEMKVHGKMLLPESASEEGLLTDRLFNVTLVITGIVFIVTHILLFVYPFLYQHKAGKRAYYYPHNNKLEVYWTVIPAIVLTILVISGWKTWNDITRPAPPESLVIDVYGKQFGWITRYPGKDGKLGSRDFKTINDINETGINFKDNYALDDQITREIYLPVNRPVKMVLGSRDVIHSAYMPHFRMQMNAVPGMPTQLWFTPRTTTAEMRTKLNDPKFDYVLLCAKICGSAHFNMQAKVVVVTEPEYQQWVNAQKPFYTEDIKQQIEAAEREKAAKVTKTVALN